MIELVIDFVSLQSYLALRPTKALTEELGVSLRLTPLSTSPASRPPSDTEEEESIAVRHQRVKANYSRMDAERYARVQGLPLTRTEVDADSSLALMGLLAANEIERGFEYADQVYISYWSNELDIQSLDSIQELLSEVGVSDFDPANYTEQLASIRQHCSERQLFQTPMYWIDGERYQSRSHLPLIKRQLTGSLP